MLLQEAIEKTPATGKSGATQLGRPAIWPARLALPSLLLGLAVQGCAADTEASGDGSSQTSPAGRGEPVTATGPITGGLGTPFAAARLDLSSHGYAEEEFFFEGGATAYAITGTADGGLTGDGKWPLAPTTHAPYKSRMLVRRPVTADAFNGTVIVEWLNVSGGVDSDPGFMYNWEEILREGYAWVGVSAQKTGIEGGGFSLVEGVAPLKEHDPERYASLAHPGDAHSFDIYTQAARVLRGEGDVDVLAGLQPERLLAYGESQSAFRMVSYVNGVQPLVGVFDGFFIHSRGSGAVPFDNEAGLALGSNTPVHIRDDVGVPVFQFQTETDVLVAPFGFHVARQPDTGRLRTWEVAGTAHADAHILEYNAGTATGSPLDCEGINDGPKHLVIKAALHSLDLWMRNGTEPPRADLLMTDAPGMALTDEHGNTRGGIRTPHVEVPIATLTGRKKPGASTVCALFGETTPFTRDKLAALYPTHADYLAKVEAAARATREAGFILPPEEATLVAEAEAAAIPE